MARKILSHTVMQEREVALVAGMADHSRRTQYELYRYCADYFWDNYRAVFFADETAADEILQNAFIALWENIEQQRIYAKEGRLMGRDDKPLSSSLLTYFMGIARLKYLEWVRENPICKDPESLQVLSVRKQQKEMEEYIGMLYDYGEQVMLGIVADVISRMSPRCSEILTKFYYEEKTLDNILVEIPSFSSKDALKTKKNKCMNSLRETSVEIYQRYLNT